MARRRTLKRRPWPRRTARLRFTAVYGVLFLISGAALIGVTYTLFERATEYTAPHLPQIPRTPALHDLGNSRITLPGPTSVSLPALFSDQSQLAKAQHHLALALGPLKNLPRVITSLRQLPRERRELVADQHRLTAAVNQLAAAVHQVARAGPIEAAQRAADSHQLLVDSGIALAVVAALALLAGWVVAGRMLRPIRTITRTARRISSTSLDERLALDGPPDELRELADTLDDLLDRLQASFEAQHQFAANASHELRTPLARQRALIQVALADPEATLASLRAAHERVLASEQDLEQMIDALLELTRGEAGAQRRERLDLAALASEALLAREPEIEAGGLQARPTLEPAPTAGDPRLIANLIDNAIAHNAPGGLIEIATGTRDAQAYVKIANTGPDVPPQEIERLFEPFQRLGAARTGHNGGHGLGLAIVRAIATAHGARLDAHPRPGGGLVIDVAFPPVENANAEPALRATSGARA
jgi:signal transduction histidine kinase